MTELLLYQSQTEITHRNRQNTEGVNLSAFAETTPSVINSEYTNIGRFINKPSNSLRELKIR